MQVQLLGNSASYMSIHSYSLISNTELAAYCLLCLAQLWSKTVRCVLGLARPLGSLSQRRSHGWSMFSRAL